MKEGQEWRLRLPFCAYYFHRHSSEGWNPGGGGQGVKGWQGLPDAAFGCRARVLAFPLCGNALLKPLDSSAACSRRRSTTYIPVGGLPPE